MTLRDHFLREIASTALSPGPGRADLVTASEVASLPEPVRRYLAFMKVSGRPRDWSFRLGWMGRFRRGQNASWMPCEAWQYNSNLAVARVMHLRIRFGGMIPVIGRDSYLAGKGRMLIKLLDRFVIGDGTGEEFDIGELVTYLNDALLLAPSMLLVPQVSWSAVDRGSFDVALTDHGRTVSGRVFVDEHGTPRDFSTTDRFLDDLEHPGTLVRGHWRTPVAEWTEIGGRPLPAKAKATWRLPQGDFNYVDFQLMPDSVAFNVPPGA